MLVFAGHCFSFGWAVVLVVAFLVAFDSGLSGDVWKVMLNINGFGEAWWELVLICSVFPVMVYALWYDCKKLLGGWLSVS